MTTDRRRRGDASGKRYHPTYRWLRRGVAGALWLVVAIVFGVLILSLYNPSLSGPAYLALIAANLIFIGVISLFSMRKLLVMFLDRRGKLKGGRLHVRLLGIFGLLATGPAIGVTLLAIWLMNQGIENWFNAKVNNALEGSLLVAEAYMDEHERTARTEVEALARDAFWQGKTWLLDAEDVKMWVRLQADKRRLDELALTDDNGDVLVSTGTLTTTVPADVVAMMRLGTERAMSYRSLDSGRIIASAPLGNGWWLVGQRSLAPAVLARVDQTNAAYAEYDELRAQREKIRLMATLMLVALAVTALAGAIWTGIQLANRIVRPVTALVHATNRVSAEDFDVRLIPDRNDELGVLTQSFNRMILQLKNSRALLEKKNKELDMRRRAMEAVLTGVTGAVLSVDGYGVVGWCNGHAERLLGVKQGLKLGKTAPEVAQLVEKVAKEPRPLVQEQVKLCCADNNTEMRTLQVRVVPQFIEGGKVGAMVVTADDITPLIGAQRVAAWRDVARRLAHEIKNPLTPIQLSAERLRRKYLKVIPPEDQELFAQLTETIVRQSEEMRRMTNEFSDFARMPEPVMQPEDIIALLEQLVALQKTAERGIAYEIDNQLAPDERTVVCDRGQIGRVLVNLIENASNAIAERDGEESGTKMPQGVVKVVVKKTHDGMLGITVLDNGRGLPPDVEVDTLFDPYVTTRKGGTGLGLAIVRKVIDEHKGSIRLARRKEGGTLVELTLPYAPLAA